MPPVLAEGGGSGILVHVFLVYLSYIAWLAILDAKFPINFINLKALVLLRMFHATWL